MNKKMKIDPNEFALAVIGGSPITANDDTRASKDALKRYLTAYYLIEQFNELEANQFTLAKNPDFKLLMKAFETLKFD
ncbi:hypothetical protein ACBP45_04300 [Latilactobacillus sakei]